MTGYGRGGAERDGWRATVEIRSVNHRYTDIKLRGSSLDPSVEERLVATLRERVERGAITVTVRIDGGAGGSSFRVDTDTARQVKETLEGLASSLCLAQEPSLELICAQPGVLVSGEPDAGSATLKACVLEALGQALDRLLEMRAVEGATLARDLEGRLDHLVSLVAEIDECTASAPDDAQRRIEERVGRLLQNGTVELDPARLAQEVAILADRHDVTEELVRLRSHFEQARSLLGKNGGSVGRRFGFLVQELGRELNTVAAKSQSSEIANSVVEAKAELEKLREQIQNIE